MIRYAGSLVLRRIGIAPVTWRWISPSGPPNRLMPGRDDRRPDAVVVEHQRLDEIVEMALVIRDVDDAAAARRLLRDVDVLVERSILRRIG